MAQKYERNDMPMRKIIINNFIGGMCWGVGLTLGATFLIAIIGYTISKLNYIPVVGNFVVEVQQFVEENSEQFNNYNPPQ